ncbi:hypothetical protein EDC01DRAFT_629906 [Geopyxis carbonaria]|nr:hypothetical protein EDC01DRAFT_629906 [Geopyxis carbonaria]
MQFPLSTLLLFLPITATAAIKFSSLAPAPDAKTFFKALSPPTPSNGRMRQNDILSRPPTNDAEEAALNEHLRAAFAGTKMEVFFDTNSTITDVPATIFFNKNRGLVRRAAGDRCETSGGSPLFGHVIAASNYLYRIGLQGEGQNNCRMDLGRFCTRYVSWGTAVIDGCSSPRKIHANCQIIGGQAYAMSRTCVSNVGGQWKVGGTRNIADSGTPALPAVVRVFHT